MRLPVVGRLNRALRPARRRLHARWLRRVGRREDAVVWLARAAPGMFGRDEIRLLYHTARQAPGPGDIAEIGSWKGRTAVTIGTALKDGGTTDCRIYCIDHHQGSDELKDKIAREGSSLDAFRRNVASAGVADLVEEMVMTSEDGAEVLAKRGVRLRMVFIDGAHDEQSVTRDIRAFLPLLYPGAIVALHDCMPGGGGWAGVWKAYQRALAGRVDELDRATSLLVTRLKAGGGGELNR